MLWFRSVANHYRAKQEELDSSSRVPSSGAFVRFLGRLTGPSPSDSEEQNRSLARSRLQSYAKEFQLLEQVFTCAQLLFFTREETDEAFDLGNDM